MSGKSESTDMKAAEGWLETHKMIVEENYLPVLALTQNEWKSFQEFISRIEFPFMLNSRSLGDRKISLHYNLWDECYNMQPITDHNIIIGHVTVLLFYTH